MTAGRLDLSGLPDESVKTALVKRLATLLDVGSQRLVLAASPQDALRACEAAGEPVEDDCSGAGVLALDDERLDADVTLFRVGPIDAPLSVIVAPDVQIAEEIAEELSQPPTVLLKAGLDALRPAARLQARADRDERDGYLQRAAPLLEMVRGVRRALMQPYGFMLECEPAARRRLAEEFAIDSFAVGDQAALFIPDARTARALADWLGASEGARSATVRRTTKETDIALSLDLDGQGGAISTGVHFFDHMLDQIARHGGLKLDVVCEGDVDVDAHHTIEDVCLALGEALREALGDKRGIARFGFETPMDETRASVWIDLSGRPYCRFDGEIPGERVGDFPVEMCAHAFRSLAETLKAAIHVKVDGENAHHMIESCFKSFGRALRMAKTIEGDALPSTKGVL
jgi:imidazoleglycerol phosphate dehydratase HisB